jgi:hypothetical protein
LVLFSLVNKKNEMILIRQFLFEKDHDTLEKKNNWSTKLEKKSGPSQQTMKNITGGKINYTKGSKMKKK